MARFLKSFQKALKPLRSEKHASGWKQHAITQPSVALRKCVKEMKETVRRIELEMTTGKVFNLVDREEFCELCFDLMMYEDKRLFDAALRLLINAFTMREIFWQKLVRVQLITHRKAKAKVGASSADAPLPYTINDGSGGTGMSLSARYLRVSGQMVLARQCMQAYEKWGSGRGKSGSDGGRGGGIPRDRGLGGGGGGSEEEGEHEKIYEYVESVLLEMSAMCLRTEVLIGSAEEGIGMPSPTDEDDDNEGPEPYMGHVNNEGSKPKNQEAPVDYRVQVQVSHDESDANGECQNLLNKMGIEDFITECLGVPLPKANDPHADLRGFSRRLRALLTKFNAFLAHFVLGNAANQALVFKHWRAVLALMPFDVGVPAVLVNLFQNNRRLCERVPAEICVAMAALMEVSLAADHRSGWQRSHMAFFRNLIMPGGVSIRANQQLVLSILTGDLQVAGRQQHEPGRGRNGGSEGSRGNDDRSGGDGGGDSGGGGPKKAAILLLLTEREEWNPIDALTASIMDGIRPTGATAAPATTNGNKLGAGARAMRARKARRYSLPGGASSGAATTAPTPAAGAAEKRARGQSGRNNKRFVYSSRAYELMATAADSLPLLDSAESYSLQQQWNDKHDELFGWYDSGHSRRVSDPTTLSGGADNVPTGNAGVRAAPSAAPSAVPWIDGYEKKNRQLYEKTQELAYHIEVIRVLAFICKGKSATFEYKCQQLMPFDIAVSVITDHKAVWAVRGAFVSFVEEAYLDSVVSKYSEESSVLANSTEMAAIVLHFAEAIEDYDEQSQVIVALRSPYTDRHLHGGGSVSPDNEFHNQLYGKNSPNGSSSSPGKRQRASMRSSGGSANTNPNDPRTGVERLIRLQSSQRKRRRRRDARSRRAQAQAQEADNNGASADGKPPATPPTIGNEDSCIGGNHDEILSASERARLAVAALSDRRALEEYIFGEVLSALSAFLQRVYVADDALPAVRAAVGAAERAVVQLAGSFSSRLRAKDQLTGERVHRPIYMLDPLADPAERRLLWQVGTLQQVLTQAADANVGATDENPGDGGANTVSGTTKSASFKGLSSVGTNGAAAGAAGEATGDIGGRRSVGFRDQNRRGASMRDLLQQQQQRRHLGGNISGQSRAYGHRKKSRVEVQQMQLQGLCDEANTKRGWLLKQPSSGGEWKRKEVSLTSSYLVYLGEPRHKSLDMYASQSDDTGSDGASSSSSGVAGDSDSEFGKDGEDDGRASLIDDSTAARVASDPGIAPKTKKQVQVKTKGGSSFSAAVQRWQQRRQQQRRDQLQRQRQKRQRKVVYFSDMIAVGAMPEQGPSAFFIKTRKRVLIFKVEQLSGYGADARWQGRDADQRSEWVRAIASVGKVAVDMSESSELLEANTLLHMVIDEFTARAESRAAAEGMEDETDTLCRKLQRHDRFAVAGNGGSGSGVGGGGVGFGAATGHTGEQAGKDSIICNMVNRMYSLTPGAGGSAGASGGGNGLDLAGGGSGSSGSGRNVELEQTCLKILIKTLDVVQQQKQEEQQEQQQVALGGGSSRSQRRKIARLRRKQMNREMDKVGHSKQSYHDNQSNAVHSRPELVDSAGDDQPIGAPGDGSHGADAIATGDGVTAEGSGIPSNGEGRGGHQTNAQSHDVIRPELARLFVHLVGGGEEELVVGAMALGISLLGEDGDPFVQGCIYDTLTAHCNDTGAGVAGEADFEGLASGGAAIDTAPLTGGVIVGGGGGGGSSGGGLTLKSPAGGQGGGEAFFRQLKDRMVRGLDLVKQKKRFRKQASAQRHGAALMFGAAGSAGGAAGGSAVVHLSSSSYLSSKKKGADGDDSSTGGAGADGSGGGDEDDGTGKYDGGYGDDSGGDSLGLVRMFRLLKLLCEGHNSNLQLLLRDETQHALGFRSTHTVLGHAKELLVTLAKSEAQLMSLDHADASTLLHLIRFFVEAVQGPCRPNQEYVASSEIVDKCSIIISANTGLADAGRGAADGVAVKDAGGGAAAGGRGCCSWFRKCGRGNRHHGSSVAGAGAIESHRDGGGDTTTSAAGTGLSGQMMYEIEAAAVNLLQSIMEGRTDDTIHVKVAQKMEMKLLRRRLLRFWSDRKAALDEGDAAEANRHMQGGLGLLVLIKMLCERAGQRARWSEARMRQVLAEEDRKSSAKYALASRQARSALAFGGDQEYAEHRQHEMAEMRSSMCMHSASIYRELEKRIISVEIVWHSQLHTVYFPKNRQCDLINPRRKEAIMGESMRSGEIGRANEGDSLHTGVAKLQKFVALCRVEKDEINRWNQLRLPVHDLQSWIPFVGLCDDLCYKCRRGWRFCFGRGDDRTNSTGVVRGLFSSGGLGVTLTSHRSGSGGSSRKKGHSRGNYRTAGGKRLSHKSAWSKICGCCCGFFSSITNGFGNWVVSVCLSSILLGTLLVCVLARLLYFCRCLIFFVVSLRSKIFSYGGAFGFR
jgi:hypothetical protein